MAEIDTPQMPRALRRALLETIPCGIVVLDAHRRVILWNSAAEEITGYSAAEMLGADCERLSMRLSAEQDPQVLRAICPYSRGENEPLHQQGRIRRRDGRLVDVVRRARPVRDERGELIGTIQALIDVSRVKQVQEENRTLKLQAARWGRLGELIGDSAPMRRLYEAIAMVAETDASVVIEGETGTGKELVARTIHAQSPRAEGPFVAVNCGALPESLLEAELFGHVKGAFTGAIADRVGRFEQAAGGTLLLDEVAELSPASQVKLLRVLQEREITRVGESQPRSVDVRILAATHADLARRVREGGFREDLFYRLRVVALRVPALRDRREDIPSLAAHFLEDLRERYAKQIVGLSHEAMDRIESCDWPGNVRQLQHALEHAFVVTPAERRVIDVSALPAEVLHGPPAAERSGLHSPTAAGPSEAASPARPGPEAERREVLAALDSAGGNKTRAAKILGITRAGLYKKLKRLGI